MIGNCVRNFALRLSVQMRLDMNTHAPLMPPVSSATQRHLLRTLLRRTGIEERWDPAMAALNNFTQRMLHVHPVRVEPFIFYLDSFERPHSIECVDVWILMRAVRMPRHRRWFIETLREKNFDMCLFPKEMRVRRISSIRHKYKIFTGMNLVPPDNLCSRMPYDEFLVRYLGFDLAYQHFSYLFREETEDALPESVNMETQEIDLSVRVRRVDAIPLPFLPGSRVQTGIPEKRFSPSYGIYWSLYDRFFLKTIVRRWTTQSDPRLFPSYLNTGRGFKGFIQDATDNGKRPHSNWHLPLSNAFDEDWISSDEEESDWGDDMDVDESEDDGEEEEEEEVEQEEMQAALHWRPLQLAPPTLQVDHDFEEIYADLAPISTEDVTSFIDKVAAGNEPSMLSSEAAFFSDLWRV